VQEHLQHSTRVDRVLPLDVAAQVRVQVPVRKLIQEPVHGMHGPGQQARNRELRRARSGRPATGVLDMQPDCLQTKLDR
jgi:hypothetical protein